MKEAERREGQGCEWRSDVVRAFSGFVPTLNWERSVPSDLAHIHALLH